MISINILSIRFKHLIVSGVFLILSALVFGETTPRKIVITGQIININFGNPISGHPVLIETVNDDSDRYHKELITDEEGYYQDTILTTSYRGSFDIITFDHNGKRMDTTVHYRFMKSVSFDIIIANFYIASPFQPNFLQARFEYFKKEGDDRNKFKFVDLTEAENIIAWYWDFGDGYSSDLQNPIHTFEELGVYKVKLTVWVKYYNHVFTNTISTQIHITNSSFSHMGGHAFAGYFPIDYAMAYLYTIDDDLNYIPVDTVKADTLGYFIFYQIPIGDYIIKIQAQETSDHYGHMLPSYYGDVIRWQDAEIIKHESTSWEYDINMIDGKGMNSGMCLINGSIVYGDVGYSLNDMPAKYVDVLLIDQDNKVLGSHYSDEYGIFNFDDIHLGAYYIQTEITGINSDRLFIGLTENDPDAVGLEIVVNVDGPNFIFDNIYNSELINKLYPNPVKSVLNIELSSELNSVIKASIIDLQGTIVLTETKPAFTNRININISAIKNGTYILNLNSGTFTERQLFVVNH